MEYETLRADRLMAPGDDVTVQRTETGIRCPLHAHDFIELVYIESGRGYHIVGGERVNVRQGDFFIISAFVPHEYSPEKGETLSLINCIFHPRAVDASLENGGDFVDVAYHYLFHSFYSEKDPRSYIKFTGLPSGEIQDVLQNMCREYACKEKGYRSVLRAQLTRLLILSFRLYTQDEGQVQSPPVLKRMVAETAREYIRREFRQSITAEQLAERFYLSVSYFNKLFKEECGMTALQYLQKVRMEEACRLLRHTNFPVAQIAADVGYSNLNFFYGLFKKSFGITPGEFREK